jgi:hypothetical protein
MPLPTNLTTNEVKNSAGTEVEFLFLNELGRSREYFKSGENPSLPERLKIQHREIGTGTSKRRQSNFLTRKTVLSGVDTVTPVEIRVSTSLDAPIGHLANLTDVTTAMAYHNSMLASDGGNTTVLYLGTGTAAAALINGTL